MRARRKLYEYRRTVLDIGPRPQNPPPSLQGHQTRHRRHQGSDQRQRLVVAGRGRVQRGFLSAQSAHRRQGSELPHADIQLLPSRLQLLKSQLVEEQRFIPDLWLCFSPDLWLYGRIRHRDGCQLL